MKTIRFKEQGQGAIVTFYVSRGDAGRRLQAKLDVATTGLTIMLEGTKPSGETYAETCTATEDGFFVETTEHMTNEPGLTRAQVVIYGRDDARMGSEQVQIMVEPLGGVG